MIKLMIVISNFDIFVRLKVESKSFFFVLKAPSCLALWIEEFGLKPPDGILQGNSNL